MRRILVWAGMVAVLIAAGGWIVPSRVVYAAEGVADNAKSTKPDADKEAGGEEGGGKPKKGNEDISGGRFAGDPVYVHLAPMVMPIISDQGVEQLVTIVIDVEVKDFDVADSMHTNMPKVQDALMRALYGGLGQGSLRNGKLVNVDRIKSKATVALRDVLGDGVREVLIQGIAQRML